IGRGLEIRDTMVQGPLLIDPEISILLKPVRSMAMAVMRPMAVGGELEERVEVTGTLYLVEDQVTHRALSRKTLLPWSRRCLPPQKNSLTLHSQTDCSQEHYQSPQPKNPHRSRIRIH